MKGKYASRSEHKQIDSLKDKTKELKTDLAAERKKRIALERKLVKQSSLRDEIARLREQVEKSVSSKYQKLEKKYSRARNTINNLKARIERDDETTGVLIGMYAQECGVTRSQAMDAWVGRLSGCKDAMILFEEHKGKIGPLTRKIEEIRRKRFEKKQYRRQNKLLKEKQGGQQPGTGATYIRSRKEEEK